MLLQIDGWRGAGKSALWTLLDGHKSIFCSPVHDTSFEAFVTESDNSEWISNRDLLQVRRFLNKTGYYKFEVFSHAKVFYLDFNAEGDRLALPFDFDFYTFDKLFFSNLIKQEKWNIEWIVDTLYKSLESVYRKQSINIDNDVTKYYVTMGGIKDWRYNSFHQVLPHAKCIQVRRDVGGIISTISNRSSNPLDKSSKSGYSKSFNQRIKEHEIENILCYYDTYDRLVDKFPNTYKVVDFKNLVENTNKTMKQIAKFLDIEFDSTLTKATRDGKELICNGKKYVGKVYDDPAQLLSLQELNKISRRKKYYDYHKQSSFPLSKQGVKKAVRNLYRKLLSK